MIRLILPLGILMLVFWIVMLPLSSSQRKQSWSAAKRFSVALVLSVAVLIAVTAVFSIGELINVAH